MNAHLILATAGHVDHGKSSLVKALTGTDPDRLPEEKARGITIDLGFAHLLLPYPGSASGGFDVGIVDVPGHEDFVKNMVAGVGSIDLALLVVAADDGWMPQTEEHFQILSYLGVRHGLVALTKSDLAGGEIERCTESVRGELAGTAWANATIVPTALNDDDSIGRLRSALVEVLSQTPLPRDIGKPRLPIDRLFTLRGIGSVVTGTLTGGVITRGQALLVQPGGAAVRVRSIQSHGTESDTAGPGTRTALALTEGPVESNANNAGPSLMRGRVVTLPELGDASRTFDVRLERSPRLGRTGGVPVRPIRSEVRIRVHHGTANVSGRLILMDRPELGVGESALAQVRLESPLFAFAGDRFIVRDWSEQTTLAGGLILEVDSERTRFRRAEQRLFLEGRALSERDAGAWVEKQLSRDGRVSLKSLLTRSTFSSAEIAQAANQLRSSGRAVTVGDGLIAAPRWNELRMRMVEAIDGFHETHPNERGLPLTQARTLIPDALGGAELCQALLIELAKQGFEQDATVIRRTAHRPTLPPPLQAAGSALRRALAAKPLDPPSRRELARTAPEQQALRFLIQSGEVVEIGPDLVLSAQSYDTALQRIKAFLVANGKGTVSELRQAVGASRRIVIPLLEKLDREGVTRRDGDFRFPGKNG